MDFWFLKRAAYNLHWVAMAPIHTDAFQITATSTNQLLPTKQFFIGKIVGKIVIASNHQLRDTTFRQPYPAIRDHSELPHHRRLHGAPIQKLSFDSRSLYCLFAEKVNPDLLSVSDCDMLPDALQQPRSEQETRFKFLHPA